VLARPRSQEEHVRPDSAGTGRTRGAHDRIELLRRVRDPGQDRRHPDRGADAGVDELRERPQPLGRRRRRRLRAPPHVEIDGRNRERHRHRHPSSRFGEDVQVADDHRPARDDRERRLRLRQHLEARARQAVAAFRRLVRVGGRADRDVLALPGRPGELGPQHVGDVDLDADRPAVALVERPVGAVLEGADVAERAAVDAAHVRVQRPPERHALDAVERRLARLLPVLDPHLAAHHRTHVRVAAHVFAGCLVSYDPP
jgi:hypothetical protein